MNSPDAGRIKILQDPEAVAGLLDDIRKEIADIDGAVMTTRDGLLISADKTLATGDSADITMHLSAMAGATAGLGGQFVEFAERGRLQMALFEGDHGCVGVFPLTSTLLLVLLGGREVNTGRFTVAAKRAIAMLLAPKA